VDQNIKKIDVSSDSLFPSTSRPERSSEFSFVPVWSRSYAILCFLYCQPTLPQYLLVQNYLVCTLNYRCFI